MKFVEIKGYSGNDANRDMIVNSLIDIYDNGTCSRAEIYDDEDIFSDIQIMCNAYRDCAKVATDKIVRSRGCRLPYQEVPRLLDICPVNDHLEMCIDRSEKTWEYMAKRTVEYKEERKRDNAEKMEKRFGENGVYSWKGISLGLPRKDGWCIVKDGNGEYAVAKYIDGEWMTNNFELDTENVVAWRYLNPTNIK